MFMYDKFMLYSDMCNKLQNYKNVKNLKLSIFRYKNDFLRLNFIKLTKTAALKMLTYNKQVLFVI